MVQSRGIVGRRGGADVRLGGSSGTRLIPHSPGCRVAGSASYCQPHEFSQAQPPTQPTGSGAGCAAKNRDGTYGQCLIDGT